MKDNKYKNLLRSRIKGAINQALTVKASIEHQGVKGSIVETLVKELFLPLLPSDIGVGTGQIIESYQNLCSTQHDIILYDKSVLPPVLFEGEVGLFPIESVLYAIEIKTTLTSQELKKSHEAAKKLLEFSYLPGLVDEHGNERHHHIERVRYVLFALSSDLTSDGKSEAQRYKKIYGSDYPHIRAICVAGKEYWHEVNGSWIKHHSPQEYDETLSFIGGVMNTYKRVSLNRGFPSLGHYIIDSQHHKKGTESIPSGTEPVASVFCDRCGARAVIHFGNRKINLNTKDGFKSDKKCMCGGNPVAPGGKYEIKNGELIRVNDYEENKIS